MDPRTILKLFLILASNSSYNREVKSSLLARYSRPYSLLLIYFPPFLAPFHPRLALTHLNSPNITNKAALLTFLNKNGFYLSWDSGVITS
jgi:hypothetical protein